jgi:hypothetical protein
MWSFRDRPTIFGNPVCDDAGECENREVIQYMWETDEWVSLGFMGEPHTYHEVIEVSGTYCDSFVDPTTTSTTTSTTMQTTTSTTGASESTTSTTAGSTNTIITTASIIVSPSMALLL